MLHNTHFNWDGEELQVRVTCRSIMHDPSQDESSKGSLTITIHTPAQPQTKQLMERLIRGVKKPFDTALFD